MATSKLHVIKAADLSNNCPECFNQELQLSFYQKHLKNRFFHRITKDVTYQLKCKKCESTLYPVKWTADIERVFEYYQKMAVPKKATIRFSALFYVLLLVLLLAVGGYFAYQNQIFTI